MEWVAIPRETTIRFYSDTGQSLAYSAYDLDRWEQLDVFWPPLGSNRVTLNLQLQGAPELWERELRHHPQFGGHVLILPGVDGVPDPFVMCAGTPETCPTRPEQVWEQGMEHHCDGILGTLRGELFWLACTAVIGDDETVVDAALTGRPEAVVLGANPDWLPNRADRRRVYAMNRANLAGADNIGVLNYRLGGSLLLIGRGHDDDCINYVLADIDGIRGQLLVFEGAGGRAASRQMVFYDVPKDCRAYIRAVVARFSDAQVRFG
ncbi:hypothetical protein [Streptomyces vinaceus]|uniref:hypothetical protein n=1 Tax=Streptomyces vinaceus TaxID=1960 RepID=UPI0036878290